MVRSTLPERRGERLAALAERDFPAGAAAVFRVGESLGRFCADGGAGVTVAAESFGEVLRLITLGVGFLGGATASLAGSG